MLRSGDTQAGFQVEGDSAARAVRVTAWGFWSPETAAAFAKTVIAECMAVHGLAQVSLDMARLKPQRDDGQQAIGSLIAALSKLGVNKIDVVVNDALTRLQLMRIAREQSANHLVRFSGRAPAA